MNQAGTSKQRWEAFLQEGERAFQDLYHYYYPLLYRYGRKFTGDHDLVKDSIQDLFLQLHDKRKSLSVPDSPTAYLLRALRNLIFNHLQRGRRLSPHPPEEEYSFGIELSIEEAIIHEQLSQEQSEQLKKSLDQLTRRQREAVYLKFYSNLSYQEIAAVMAIQYQSAVNLVHEAIKVLGNNLILPLFVVAAANL